MNNKNDEIIFEEMAELFGAFSDPSRLRIISILTEGEMNVNSIAEAVGLTESATSHQLRTLRQLRLVRKHKEGRQVFYSLDDEHIKGLYQFGFEHILHNRE
jgi:DNA-binding transcriptional ArsR family regulator